MTLILAAVKLFCLKTVNTLWALMRVQTKNKEYTKVVKSSDTSVLFRYHMFKAIYYPHELLSKSTGAIKKQICN